MQLPLFLKVYVVACPEVRESDVLTALETYNISHGIAPEFAQVEAFTAEELSDEMRGRVVLLGDDAQLEHARTFIGDTAIVVVSSTYATSQLLSEGFAGALHAGFSADELAAALTQAARLSLLRRRLDIREFSYQAYFRISDNMMWTKDMGDLHMDVNHYVTHLTGKQIAEVEGLHEIDVYDLDPNDPGCGESDRIVRETCEERTFDETMPDTEGVQHHLAVVKTPWLDGQGRIVGTIGIGKDTTALLNKEAQFENFLNSINLGVAIADMQDRFLQGNTTLNTLMTEEDMEGTDMSELIGRYLRPIAPTQGAPEHEGSLGLDMGDHIEASAMGSPRVWNISRFILNNYWGEQSGYTYIFRDVTEDRRQRRAIQNMAVTDALTGAANRSGMYAYVEEADPATHALFLFIDIDNFKLINDTLGHAEGDRFLTKVVQMLRRTAPSAHIARYGGDEFLLVIPSIHGVEEAAELASRILAGAADIRDTSNIPAGSGSLSIGVVCDAAFSEDIDDIVYRCDAAMYAAKRAGKNRYCLA